MRFFQSESHSKPDETDNTDDTVRTEPVPAQRVSDENDTDRGPDTADSPHLSTGHDDADDRPHVSDGSADIDRDGHADDEPRPVEDDSSVRDGGPVDTDVVPDEPVFVEPAPQETAFGAATVGGAVAASEQAARREVDDSTAVGTAAVPHSEGFGAADDDADRTTGSDADRATGSDADRATESDADRALGAGAVEGFGSADDKPVRTGDEVDEAEVVEADRPFRDEAVDGFGPAHLAEDEDGKPIRAEAVDGATPAHLAEDEDGKPVRAEAVEGFGTAGDTEGFGTAEDKPLRAADAHDADGVEDSRDAAGLADDRNTAGVEDSQDAAGLADNRNTAGVEESQDAAGVDEDDRVEGEPVKTDVADTTALGVAAGAAAGAAAAGVASKDRDRDGHPDSQRVAPDGEPLVSDASAAVPIEPVPAPADAIETPTATDEPVELLPGDVPEQPALAAFFSQDKATDFRDRWREVQLRFVDDPAQAASDAGTLIDEVVTALNAAIAEQREALGGNTSGAGDTEQLRVLVRRQRDFLDRILGL